MDRWMTELITAATDELAARDEHIGLASVVAQARRTGCGVLVDERDGVTVGARVDRAMPPGALRYRKLHEVADQAEQVSED